MLLSLYLTFALFTAVELAHLDNDSPTIGKTKVVPDLNGPPPTEDNHSVAVSHGINHVSQATLRNILGSESEEQRRRRHRSNMIDLNQCDHHRGCEHWKSLPSTVRDRISKKIWIENKPPEERKRMSRGYSKKWHSKLTPKQKEIRNQRMRLSRLHKKLNKASEKKETQNI